MSAPAKQPERETTAQRATVVAANLFAAHGYTETSTRELAKALGVTKGTFYHHFLSKEALLVQICDESLTRITSAALEADNEAGNPLSRLEALIRGHVNTMLADQALHKTMLTELRSLTADNYDRVLGLRDTYSAILRDAIKTCQADGVLSAGVDPHLLTLLLLNLLNWTIFWYQPSGEHTPSEIADATVTTFLDGWQV
ncbi:MAG TPA: TetR/AcrR family transcriptional regulator [Solirubrobacteraceae bacterium]|jgi:AcrR family transcriptional regulator